MEWDLERRGVKVCILYVLPVMYSNFPKNIDFELNGSYFHAADTHIKPLIMFVVVGVLYELLSIFTIAYLYLSQNNSKAKKGLYLPVPVALYTE